MNRVAIVGGGAMGGAIVDGILARTKDTGSAVDVVVVEANPELARAWRSRGDVHVADLAEGTAGADVVFLAVKPNQIVDVLREAAVHLRGGCVVVSIAAGVPLSVLEGAAPDVAIVRTMPNTPMRVGRGVVGLSRGVACSDSQVAEVTALLESIARVVEIPENLIDALTATSGSGPAYVFYFAEVMTSAAIELGLPLETASALVADTIMGAAYLLAENPGDPAGLRAAVTSPGGTTAAAIATFDDADLGGIVERGMRAARDRAEEMAREQADAAR